LLDQRLRSKMLGPAASDDYSSDDEKVPGGNFINSESHKVVRMGFIRKVYTIVGMQLLLTFLVAYPMSVHLNITWLQQNLWFYHFCSYGSLALVLGVTCCCPRVLRTFPQNYAFLLAFTLLEAGMVGCLTTLYKSESVLMVTLMTAVLVASLTLYAVFTKHDFTGCGPYLYGCLLAMNSFVLVMFIFMLCGIPIPSGVHLFYSALCVVLFSVYLIHDTQMIVGAASPFGNIGGQRRHEYSVDDYIMAAFQLYMDIVLLFIHLLSLFGERKN
jgi:FtsH-binding integral membrane protein